MSAGNGNAPGAIPRRSAQTDQAEPKKSTAVVLGCQVCGAETLAVASGAVQRITIDHEPGCAFYEAVIAGEAVRYIRAHGYPIYMVPVRTTGAA